jgi:hypothetical protein
MICMHQVNYLSEGWLVADPYLSSGPHCNQLRPDKLANNAYFYYMHDTQRYDTIAYFTHTVILTSWNIFHPETD